MDRAPQIHKASLISCSIPAVIVALIATLAAGLGWGNLSFSSTTYYAWCAPR
jgi:hypothetical protein